MGQAGEAAKRADARRWPPAGCRRWMDNPSGSWFTRAARNCSDVPLVRVSCVAGLKYDPSTGIYGMDCYVVMKRTGGLRVAKRRAKQTPMGIGHRIHKKETQQWFKNKYEGVLMN